MFYYESITYTAVSRLLETAVSHLLETAVSHLLEIAVSHPLEIDAIAAGAATFLKYHVKGESSKTDLCIIHFNARSLHPKIDELRVYCAIEKPDIVCISEKLAL